jgi:hypothetical protein
MGICKNHPSRETWHICLKHNYYLCSECLQCNDPEIYCTFRSSCVIFFLTLKKGDAIDREDTALPQQTLQGEQL